MKSVATPNREFGVGFSSRSMAMTVMILASIALSFSGLIVRNIEAANPSQINFYRNLAFITVISLILIGRYRQKSTQIISRVNLATVCAALCLGVAGIAIVQAYTHTTIANTVFCISATPIITMALAYFFIGERISRSSWIAMIVAMIGLSLTISGGLGAGNTYGNLMALLTAFGFSGFAVIVRGNHQEEMLPALILAGLFVILASFSATYGDLFISAHDLALCILWGAALSGAAHWIFLLSARQLQASELTLFTLLETALAPLWVWIFMRELPETLVIAGGALVIAAVGGRALLEQKLSPVLR